jgi:hypothetical protein
MKRFSLKFLFAVTTVLIVFLGYSQWRRQWMIKQCEFLREEGVYVDLPNDTWDFVWQRRPSNLFISIQQWRVAWATGRIDNQEQVICQLKGVGITLSDFAGVPDYETHERVIARDNKQLATQERLKARSSKQLAKP